ncbi:uncharacterized protein LAESUDRAFT_735142 [Laetiporus sulphureus 93-53]|uniref:Protein transport protein sec16 n=1 Tax=Laetiporus sulphureus 93-53 TaxID=1314785 RepID=A0A165FUH6_9APHY|nr:uncharacterized protein LAESUDRAFT_735142 [Laetiporus sulphureus 93-53]KZT09428.1 hypothetical protein LAESUDRAFT_735142 [Laetiporus sulphureus 93-53]
MSNGSVLSSISAVLDDPYAPVQHSRSSLTEQTSRGSLSGPYAAPSLNGMHTLPRAVPQDLSASQILNAPAQIMGIYAPSPSLLGLNDPLGRTSVRVPVVSFGFGGKLVTCFHGMSSDVGFDVALSSRQSTDIKINKLHKVIPESALDTSAASYPGPLFSDPGTPTTSLVRAGAATQAKTKKARVIKYLEERSEEIGRSLGYFHQGSLEARRAEAKHILVKLLKVMVENDGHLSGSPHIDTAVRAALVPRLAPNPSLKTASSLSLSRPVDFQPQSPNIAPMYPEIASPAQGMTESPMAVHTLKPSNLDKIQEYLLRGDRRAACHYASDEKLWAHAMVIASSIDKETWKEVVTEFVRTELASTDSRSVTQTSIPGEKARLSDGRESLRVAYSLFSGKGPASIQELLPPKPLMQSAQTLQLPPSSVSSLTPISASFSAPVEPMNIPGEILVRWPETSAMMFASPLTLETSSALTALGDQLAVNQWYEAAHACYLLSPQTSPIGGVGSSSRVVLIGAENPATSSMFVKDPDPIILSEIVEFAMSLAAPTKGQDAFVGLPHLQPYRLVRATSLAEMGHIQLANRYCEAIATCLNRTSPYMNPTFIEQLKGLSDRLTAAPQLDKTASWIGSKVSKPSLDSIGNWLEGRLTKFIAGDGDSLHAEDHAHAGHQQPFSGPFAHYSTITSANSSAVPSPQQSRVDLNEMPNSPPPPFRTGSAMAYRPSAASYVPMNRASSAMDYIRPSFQRKPSPIPRVSSANATASPYADGSLYSQALNGYAFGSSRTGHTAENGGSTGTETATWWGVSESDAPTPTASSFSQVHENEASMSSSRFLSLMDDPAYSTMTSVSQTSTAYSRHEPTVAEEDEDDLGLGNSSTRAKRPPSDADEKSNTPRQTEEPKEEANPTQDTEKPEPKPASSGSWLSRLWRRDSAPAPIRANLGEQTTFYYDKELKRWVNKSAGPEAAKPAPPPPPPRAQTASPGRSHASLPAGVNLPLPPARPATANAVSFGNGPPRPPMRVRSNLVPAEAENGSAPPTPASATMPTTPGVGPPPGGRSRAQAKRPVRNRYVDVFQQQATSS